ncbi:YcxB family protein [Clostridium sp. HBUAS56010]|uniref:YcxB family protein n=1 Tax=Clostridium sp. HBUAS56010 TaxID=2571127 RepID=UPI001178ADDD|nr:YcxB family protein [Clostridium sp. HBUAS56010]
MMIMYEKAEVDTIVEFCDVIRLTTEGRSQREISYNHVIGYKETKRLLVLILGGKMLIPISKDGFIE